MKPILTIFTLLSLSTAFAQQKPTVFINGTAHLGNGKVIEKAAVTIQNGIIISVEEAKSATIDPTRADVIDINNRHLYPGMIAPNTKLGLEELEAVRATLDYQEVGSMNPNVRSVIAYNAESKIIPTVRSNGVLLAQITPQGDIMPGTSSVMKLNGWNWEDATQKADVAIHLNWPTMYIINASYAGTADEQKERTTKALKDIKTYFDEAKAYAQLRNPEPKNLKFEAMRGLFNGSKKLFIRADFSKEIIAAVNFAKNYNIKPVIVGADDATLVIDFLKQNNVAVILDRPHSLPTRTEEDIDLPYKKAKILHDGGILCALSIYGSWQQRNLPFMAGTVSAYGLTKEEALSMVTFNTAKILGIDKTVGTIEKGKEATLFISTGDALDMRGNNVELAYIQGKKIDLNNRQKELYETYKKKYEEAKK